MNFTNELRTYAVIAIRMKRPPFSTCVQHGRSLSYMPFDGSSSAGGIYTMAKPADLVGGLADKKMVTTVAFYSSCKVIVDPDWHARMH